MTSPGRAAVEFYDAPVLSATSGRGTASPGARSGRPV